MKAKELLCIALISDGEKRYDAEIYSDGTFKNEDGEFYRLSPEEFKVAQVLARRANRERMLTVVANEVVPYRDGDAEPEPYTENLLPYTEEDFMLPAESDAANATSASYQVTDDADAIDEMLQQQMEDQMEEGEPAPLSQTDSGATDKTDKETEQVEKETETTVQEAEAPKPKRKGHKVAIIIGVLLALIVLCGVGFGLGYINGYFNLGPLQSSTSVVSSSVDDQLGSDSTTSEPASAPAQLPPKTEINLTINAMEGAEVSGSTDVGVNEDAQEEVSSATTSDGTSSQDQ